MISAKKNPSTRISTGSKISRTANEYVCAFTYCIHTQATEDEKLGYHCDHTRWYFELDEMILLSKIFVGCWACNNDDTPCYSFPDG